MATRLWGGALRSGNGGRRGAHPGRAAARLAAATFVSVATAACTAPTMLESATPSSPGRSVRALVLGRVQVYVRGQAARVGPAGRPATRDAGEWGGGAPPVFAPEADTMIVFESLRTGDRYGYELPDDTGGFQVLLPPGRYEIKLRFEKYLVDTPARFEAPEGGQQYYIGTLRAKLFQTDSVLGWRTRIFGGRIPSADSDFRVVDEWDWATDNLRAFSERPVRVEKYLMALKRSG